jgi:ssDNA-binding Zn-finger/Zn-ribbon topoisomerase 1
MKKKKEWNFFGKLRNELRKIYRGSPMRRAALKAGTLAGQFTCPECKKTWPKELADVDHEPPCGSLLAMDDVVPFTKRLLYGDTRLMCKMCHKKKSARQRAKS